YLQFNKVKASKSGRTTIDICHAGVANAKIRLTVNNVDYSFLNTLSTGGLDHYTGHTYLTVPLNAGATNTIKITGGTGEVNIDYLTVSPF
ncbi:MAG: DUF5010 C-terminal domain-containing protein, partial [Bacteroidota bacterium]|nr:DUF5010 C-terminal domain-containing protein [Bacteroidota bacterium]